MVERRMVLNEYGDDDGGSLLDLLIDILDSWH